MTLLIIPVAILIILIIIIMQNIKASPSTDSTSSLKSSSGRASARDFFLHLGSMVALYAASISFLNLFFRIINKAFPEVANNPYAWGGGSEISLPVATLIIVFPLFILLSFFVQKIYSENPQKKELGVKKWLTYITLFVAGVVLVGDLVTVLYKFLDGQDLTAAFILKALVVILVTGCVFGFYLQDIRDRISNRGRKIWALSASFLLLATIIWGFAVLGSPKTQRLIRLDNQKISDLQNIQWQVINYWQMNGALPANLEELKKQEYGVIPKDPQTNTDYKYEGKSNMTFELCAEFNAENMSNQYRSAMPVGYAVKSGVIQNENWNHKAGYQCFDRVIDQVAYPTQIKG